LHKSINNLALINNQIKSKFGNTKNLNIIAVSKTFPLNEIQPLINNGHIHFGENKVQEAVEKWTNIKSSFQDLRLHLIGRLQTNKVKHAVSIFDYIHSLDSIKLAEKISIEQNKIKRNLKLFIQINLGNEKQKSGIDKNNLKDFYKKCTKEFKLNVIGLMCIPPQGEEVKSYFKDLEELNKFIGLKDLSMGMSSDYLDAIDNGATFIRIGSKIFGNRS
jgi:pyridoxal phosphate enzyme (YggS family)